MMNHSFAGQPSPHRAAERPRAPPPGTDQGRPLASAGPGEICALIGSTEHVEIAANTGSAAAQLGLGPGAEVTIARG